MCIYKPHTHRRYNVHMLEIMSLQIMTQSVNADENGWLMKKDGEKWCNVEKCGKSSNNVGKKLRKVFQQVSTFGE